MTNDIDRLLEQVADALEEQEALWTPDLTAPVLPSFHTEEPAAPEKGGQAGQPENAEDVLAASPTPAEGSLTAVPSFLPLEEEEASPELPESGALPRFQTQADTGPFGAYAALPARQAQARFARQPAGEDPEADLVQGGAETSPAGALRELSSLQGEDAPQGFARASAAQDARPALLERLQALEQTQASVEALQQKQSSGGAPAFRVLTGQGGMDASYSLASRAGPSLAATAATTQESDQARAVDRAFQRDSRRYDRGFSLY